MPCNIVRCVYVNYEFTNMDSIENKTCSDYMYIRSCKNMKKMFKGYTVVN